MASAAVETELLAMPLLISSPSVPMCWRCRIVRTAAANFVAWSEMATYNLQMAISVSKFKNSCLDLIRRVEATGQSVSITRRGKVVARLAPSFQVTQGVDVKPWQQLRALGGELLAEPSESVVREEDFEALR
jgi:prevent-host-death family protein